MKQDYFLPLGLVLMLLITWPFYEPDNKEKECAVINDGGWQDKYDVCDKEK